MKKIVLVSLLALASSGAFAVTNTAVCNGAGAATALVHDGNFIATDFTPHCSANVYVQYSEDQTKGWVGSASKKGKSYFGGSTAGGGVVNSGSCAASTGCTNTDAASGLTAAASIS